MKKKIIPSVLIVLLLLSSVAAASTTERVGNTPTYGVKSLTDTSGLTTTDLNTLTPEQLVNSLLGSGVKVTKVKYTGAKVAAGTFSGGSDNIGIKNGIVLSSGAISSVVGSNKNEGTSTINEMPGDTDLDGLIPGYSTNDAASLEFSFIPDSDQITFKYVFGSEEYNEYVGSSFNDVFGFFLNGKNVALIPGTSTPVSINNVNLNSYPNYYINNDLNSGAKINTELDGLTTILTVTVPVNKGKENTIKLATADAGDSILDSDVFIEGGSFTSADFFLSPSSATNEIGNIHTLTAELKSNTGEPIVGNTVNFKITEGPKAGLKGSNITGSQGKAAWSYTSSVVGTDKIYAYVGTENDPKYKSNVVTNTWMCTIKPPVAEFSGTPTSGKAPLNVAFTDKSTGSPTSWYWNFGDGTSSKIQNPTHKYSKTGSYTVALTVSNAAGNNTVTKTGYITVVAKPIAAFSASPTSGKAPLSVQFTDKSANSPTSWKWNFGDGTSSTEKNPKHEYLEEGNYKVTLTVTNTAGSSTATKTDYIKVITNTRPGLYSENK
jgi:FOG: PKD repeat